MVSWAYKTQKYEGKTLDKAFVDLSTAEKCSGMTLALSRVRKLRHLLLRPFFFESSKKRNNAKQLQSIRTAIQRLKTKLNQTQLRYPNS